MKALVVYSHPNPMSFNAAVAKVVQEELEKKQFQVKVKDLYAMNWNPVLSAQDFEGFHTGNIAEDIKKEQADVASADLIVMIAPVWWYSVPALLKGYIDRVFSIGFAYKYTSTGPQGLLAGKKALVITTSGADEKAAKDTHMLDAVYTALVQGVFGFCGFDKYEYKNFFAVPTVSDAERKQMLTETRELISRFA
ncbi:NAD(P)H-dependent oxidoreductase [Syntrophomonas erecta]